MKTKTTIPERLKMIKACQASGLSVAEWCRRNGLNDNTYFNWVTRLRRKGLLETPAVIPETIPHEVEQPEIVKVEIAPQASCRSDLSGQSMKCLPEKSGGGAVMEIALGGVKIKVTNQVNAQLLEHTLRVIGGAVGC